MHRKTAVLWSQLSNVSENDAGDIIIGGPGDIIIIAAALQCKLGTWNYRQIFTVVSLMKLLLRLNVRTCPPALLEFQPLFIKSILCWVPQMESYVNFEVTANVTVDIAELKGDSINFNIKVCVRSWGVLLRHVCSFKTLVPTLPTMHLSHWATSLEAVCQIPFSFLWSF